MAEIACRLILFAKLPLLGEVKTRVAADLGDEVTLELYKRLLFNAIDQLHLASIAAFPSTGQCRLEWHYAGRMHSSTSLAVEYARSKGFDCIEQTGADLGIRMANAFTAGLDKGALPTPALLIGSDVPDLDQHQIGLAIQSICGPSNAPVVVLNPTADGGYCLIGHSANFNIGALRQIFAPMQWSTSSVFAQTQIRIASILHAGQAVSCELLSTLSDIDTANDARRYLKL